MIYRQLGRSPLRVSALCLGTMMFADQTDAREAGAILADAREHGVNFIDTADVYSTGGSESMLGELRATRPELYRRVSEVRQDGRDELVFRFRSISVRASRGVSAARLAEVEPVEADLARREVRPVELDLRFRDQVIARLQ